jgi:hypothetical protein
MAIKGNEAMTMSNTAGRAFEDDRH